MDQNPYPNPVHNPSHLDIKFHIHSRIHKGFLNPYRFWKSMWIQKSMGIACAFINPQLLECRINCGWLIYRLSTKN